MTELARESLPVLVVALFGLQQIRHWQAVLNYEAIIQRLREEIAFLRPTAQKDG